MKIRTGFISNSSSTSYVILLPKDFKPHEFMEKHIKEVPGLMSEMLDLEPGEYDKRVVVDTLTEFINKGYLWESDSDLAMSVLPELLKEYVICELETGPESGIITLANRDRAIKILGKEMR